VPLVLRRIVVLAVLALVVGLGVATASTQATADDVDHQSCVSSVECGGASVLVSIGLAMVLPAVQSGLQRQAPVTRLVGAPVALRPRLLASRLYRPPRPS